MAQTQFSPLIISGYSSKNLANDIAEHIGSRAVVVDHTEFTDGELRIEFEDNILDRSVVVIASGAGDPNTQFVETLFLLGAAKTSGAKKVTLVLPYMFYGRADSNFDERSVIGLQFIITALREYCDHVIVADPHNATLTQALFQDGAKRRCDVLHFGFPQAVQLKYLFNEKVISKDNLLFLNPDIGAGKRITKSHRTCLYNQLGITNLDASKSDEWAQAAASRDHKTHKKNITLNQDVTGMDVFMFEDILASGGTARSIAEQLKNPPAVTIEEICNKSEELAKRGARSSNIFVTTGQFTSGKKDGVRTTEAIERINDSALDTVFITNTYSYHDIEAHRHLYDAIEESPIIHVMQSTAYYLAEAIRCVSMSVTPEMDNGKGDKNANSISALKRGEHISQTSPHTLLETLNRMAKGTHPLQWQERSYWRAMPAIIKGETPRIMQATPLKHNSPLRKLAFG